MPITCDVDFIVVGVLGERGPCDEEGEVGTQLISSSTTCGCGPTVAVSICACEEGKREGGREGDRWLDLGMLCCREVCTCVFTINVYKDQLLYGTCTRIVHVHDPSPYHILAHVLSHVPVFIHCSCPKKTGTPYCDTTPPISLITPPTPPTPSLSTYLPPSNITMSLHTSPLLPPPPPSPLPRHPTPPPHSTYLLLSHTGQFVPPPGPSPRISVHSLQSLAPARINGTSTPLHNN